VPSRFKSSDLLFNRRNSPRKPIVVHNRHNRPRRPIAPKVPEVAFQPVPLPWPPAVDSRQEAALPNRLPAAVADR
jgi:hypothetical protein